MNNYHSIELEEEIVELLTLEFDKMLVDHADCFKFITLTDTCKCLKKKGIKYNTANIASIKRYADELNGRTQ